MSSMWEIKALMKIKLICNYNVTDTDKRFWLDLAVFGFQFRSPNFCVQKKKQIIYNH